MEAGLVEVKVETTAKRITYLLLKYQIYITQFIWEYHLSHLSQISKADETFNEIAGRVTLQTYLHTKYIFLFLCN